MLPWQTIGGKNCWQSAEQTALFYPTGKGPLPSVRLKAFRRGQQDVAYFNTLCRRLGVPRFALADLFREAGIQERMFRSSASDAGTVGFDGITPHTLWTIRCAVGSLLNSAGSGRQTVDFSKPAGAIGKIPDVGYVFPAPKNEALKPACDGFRP